MNVRKLAHTLLLEYELMGKYVNLSLSSHKADGLAPNERAILTQLLYTTVERKLTLDYYIAALAKRPCEKIDVSTLCLLRLGLCQIIYMNSVPNFAAVNETVKLARNRGEAWRCASYPRREEELQKIFVYQIFFSARACKAS